MKNKLLFWRKVYLVSFSICFVAISIAAFTLASEKQGRSNPYHPASESGAIASVDQSYLPKVVLITRQMIDDRSASCSEMISPQDKVRCLNKLRLMKKDFIAQKSAFCDYLPTRGKKDSCSILLDEIKTALRPARSGV